MSVSTSADARISATRRAPLRYILESSRIPGVLMADPLDSGDDVSALIKPQASRYIHANVTPLLDL